MDSNSPPVAKGNRGSVDQRHLPCLFDVFPIFDGCNFRQTIQDDLEGVYGHSAQEFEFYVHSTFGTGRKSVGAQQGDFMGKAVFEMNDAIDAVLRHNLTGLESLSIQANLLPWIFVCAVYQVNPTISKQPWGITGARSGSGIGQMTDTTSLTLCLRQKRIK